MSRETVTVGYYGEERAVAELADALAARIHRQTAVVTVDGSVETSPLDGVVCCAETEEWPAIARDVGDVPVVLCGEPDRPRDDIEVAAVAEPEPPTVAERVRQVLLERRSETDADATPDDAPVYRGPDAYYAVDEDWTITAWDPIMEDRTGRGSGEVLGEHAWDVLEEAVGTDLYEAYREVMAVREPTTIETRYEPGDYWIRVRVYPTDDGGLEFYSRDVTEEKERERELRRQNERLDEFVSVVGHDLRNPLQVAQARLDLYRRTGESEHLGVVERNHERMDELLDDLLELARHGEAVEDPERVPLADVCRTAWSAVETPAADLRIEGDVSLRAERGRLCELFENLFSNAVEHGGPDVIVRVGAFEDGFYVADDGPGIPGDVREEVFDHGFTTDRDGTGFGLSIVAEIAAAHDWSVTATESAEGGARFEVTGITSLSVEDA